MDKKKIVWIILILVILLGILVYRKGAREKIDGKVNEYILSDISVTTEVTSGEAQDVINFLKKSLKENYVPKELTILKAFPGKDKRPAEYRGSWNSDGQYLSVLYVPQFNSQTPFYIRVWVLPQADEVDVEKATSMLKEIFKDDFISLVGNIACHKIKLQDGGGSPTECGSLKTQENGGLLGVTVRSPVTIEESDINGTAVSACFVPKESTSLYSSSLCD